MPAQITRHRSQGRQPEYTRPGIRCYRKMATPANDTGKEGPRMASCQNRRNEKSEKGLLFVPIRDEVASKPLQGKGLSLEIKVDHAKSAIWEERLCYGPQDLVCRTKRRSTQPC